MLLDGYRPGGRGFGMFPMNGERKKVNKQQEYIAFLEDIIERTEHFFEGKVTGEVFTTIKNNNVPVTGVILKSTTSNIAPSFYLEKQFMQWMQGKCTMDETVEELCRIYQKEVEKSAHLIQDIQWDWEKFRERVFPRLINRERNEAALSNLPYQEFLDLALVYYYAIPISEGVMGSMLVTQEHLTLLNVTSEELHRVALENYQAVSPVKFSSMADVLLNLGRRFGITEGLLREKSSFLYVLTNSTGMHGAVSMFFSEELRWFAKQLKSNFFILPSSVHEVILVPEFDNVSIAYFSDMVREINETQVDATEVLSDSVYYYDRNTEALRRVG